MYSENRPGGTIVPPRASGQQGKTPASHAGGAGSVTPEAHQISPEDTAKFWMRVTYAPDFHCWEWTGQTRNGYGHFRGIRSHRLAYALVNGPIEDGEVVRHRCDNKLCCNPRHLETGSHSDNMQDAIERGQFATGRRHGRTKLTEQQVTAIRRNKDKMTVRALAERYGIAASTVSYIRSGRSWKHHVA